jgi:hypothetical protein
VRTKHAGADLPEALVACPVAPECVAKLFWSVRLALAKEDSCSPRRHRMGFFQLCHLSDDRSTFATQSPCELTRAPKGEAARDEDYLVVGPPGLAMPLGVLANLVSPLFLRAERKGPRSPAISLVSQVPTLPCGRSAHRGGCSAPGYRRFWTISNRPFPKERLKSWLPISASDALRRSVLLPRLAEPTDRRSCDIICKSDVSYQS